MVSERIAALAADRVSGASDILGRAIQILREALAGGADVADTARALVGAQPSMAPVWNAALAALATRDDPRRFETFSEHVARAPALLTRCALDLLGERAHMDAAASGAPRARGAALRVVTLSYSGSVLAALEAIGRTRPLEVSCGEGRPALEGRALAARLAASGIGVTCTTDAALGEALTSADAVLVGADAVTAGWFLNKVGTRMLAAAAAAEGVPMYVVASRDKFASAAVAARLRVREGEAAEVWSDPPPGVGMRNVYFERAPLGEITGVISDIGILGIDSVRQVCEALEQEIPPSMVDVLDG